MMVDNVLRHLGNRRTLLVVVLIILFLIFNFSWAVFTISFAWQSVIIGFLVNALAAVFAIAIGIDLIQKHVDAATRRANIGQLVDFWTSASRPHFKIYTEVTNSQGKRAVGFDTMSALTQLTAILTRIHGDALRYEVIDAKKIGSIDDLHRVDANVILLGGDRSIPITVHILKNYNSKYQQHCNNSPRKIVRTVTGQDQQIVYESIFTTNGEHQHFDREYGLVTRIPVKDGSACWYLLAGNHGVGTYLAALSVSDPGKFPKIEKIGEHAIQALVHGEGIIRSSIPNKNIEVLSLRNWEALT